MTRRSEVCVAENETTLLSTSPADFAAAMTSTSRSVAALPLRDTTQIAPFGRIRVAELLESGQVLGRVGAEEDDVRVGLRRALGKVRCPLGEQRADRLVVDLDQRDAHPRPDPELVEQRRGVDPFHGRYRAI